MAQFSVEQVVLCEVRVWYRIEDNNHTDALAIVAQDKCPTSMGLEKEFRDYEIISDREITYTQVIGVE